MREKNNLSRGKIPAPPPPGYQMARPLIAMFQCNTRCCNTKCSVFSSLAKRYVPPCP